MVQETSLKCCRKVTFPFLEGESIMKKNLLMGGLLPALVLGSCGVAGAQPAAMDTLTAIEQNPETVNQAKAATEPVTQESLQEMRRQLEEQLQQAQELQNRLNAQLGSLEKRMKKVEKKTNDPRLNLYGYARLRYNKHKFANYTERADQQLYVNFYTDYHINDKWSIKSEMEINNNFTDNTVNDGTDSVKAWQAYAEGHFGDASVKLGKFWLGSPYLMTMDEKVNGFQINWGTPLKWGRAQFTLSAGNTFSNQRSLAYNSDGMLVPKIGVENWSDPCGSKDFRVISLMGTIPVAKNTNLVFHYGDTKDRDNTHNYRMKMHSIGFDTKLNRDLKLSAAIAKSDADFANKSHMIKLQYKEARPDIPGSYDIYIKKYLQRIHTGLDKLFYDDIAYPPDARYDDGMPGVYWNNRVTEFNGLRVGIDLVPVKNSKLMLNYTFGDMGGTILPEDKKYSWTGKKYDYSFFRAEWQFYF